MQAPNLNSTGSEWGTVTSTMLDINILNTGETLLVFGLLVAFLLTVAGDSTKDIAIAGLSLLLAAVYMGFTRAIWIILVISLMLLIYILTTSEDNYSRGLR